MPPIICIITTIIRTQPTTGRKASALPVAQDDDEGADDHRAAHPHMSTVSAHHRVLSCHEVRRNRTYPHWVIPAAGACRSSHCAELRMPCRYLEPSIMGHPHAILLALLLACTLVAGCG